MTELAAVLAHLEKKLDAHADVLLKHIAEEDDRTVKIHAALYGNGKIGLAEQVRSNAAHIAELIALVERERRREGKVWAWLAASLGSLALTGLVGIAVWIIRQMG